MLSGNLFHMPSGWQNHLATGTSANAVQKRREFIGNVLDIVGDSVLWLPVPTDTTTSTDFGRGAHVFTYDATIAARFSAQGSGSVVSFNGTSQYASVPDAANLTFGNAVVDDPFSIIAWVNQTATTGIKEILSKYDITTGSTKREYRFFLDAAEKLNFLLYDESAAAYIGRLYNTALATGSLLFVAGTYDGTMAASGLRCWSAAAAVDATDASSGTYVAMENTASSLYLGASKGASAVVNFFSGSQACVVLARKELSRDELWALKDIGNAYFGVSL